MLGLGTPGQFPCGGGPNPATETSSAANPEMFTSRLRLAAAILMMDDGMTDASLREQPPEYFDDIRKRLVEIAQTVILKPDMFRLG